MATRGLAFPCRGVGSIPGQALKVPHASWPEKQNMKSRSNIVTNFRNGPHQKKKKKKKKKAQKPRGEWKPGGQDGRSVDWECQEWAGL